MVNLILLNNLIFLSILSLTYQTSVTKSKFLSFAKDYNKNDNNNLLQIHSTTSEDNLLDLISEYRKKLLKNVIFTELIKNKDNKFPEKIYNNSHLKENKIFQKDFLEAILIENKNGERTESFFNTTEFIWENLPTIGEPPTPRRGQSVLLADTYLIVFGGSDLNSKFFNDVFYFDLIKKTWMKINALGNIPESRADHSAVLYGTTMWIFGGASSNGYLNDLYSFNIENREWKKHEFMGKAPRNRRGHSAIMDDQAKIFIFGGYSEFGHANDLLVINILAERYENPLLSGRAPVPREKSVMFYLDKTLYIYGGHQNGIIYNDMFKLNLLNLIWEKVEITGFNPIGFKGFSGERVGKKIYITGGCDFENKFCNEETFIFDSTNSSWSKLSDIQKNSKNAQSYLESRLSNATPHLKRSFTSIQFFRGAIVSFGGCDMLKECFRDIKILNLEEPCPSNCSDNGFCGGKLLGCHCNNDFISHDCSLKIKCKEDCNKNGFCKSNAKCACFSGWSSETCSAMVNCPRNCTTATNGVCQLDGTCLCNKGFLGKDCAQNANIINVNPLINLINGNDNQIKQVNSELKEEFKTEITIEKGKCPNNCSGNGDCNTVLKKCNCKEPYYGEDCSQKKEIHFEIKNEETPFIPIKIPEVKRIIEAPPEKWRIFYINTTLYKENDKCDGGCGDKGICLNSTCLCDQGLTGEKCSMTYKDVLQRGYNPLKYIKHYTIIAGTAMTLTLLFRIFKR